MASESLGISPEVDLRLRLAQNVDVIRVDGWMIVGTDGEVLEPPVYVPKAEFEAKFKRGEDAKV